MAKLEIEPFKVGEMEVTEVSIRKLNFLEFIGVAKGATNQKQYTRQRIMAAVTFNGEKVTSEQIPLLPIPVAKEIMNELNSGEGNGIPGVVLSGDADGIHEPVLYKLGTPLKMKNSKGEVLIEELEFQAKTFGDIEDIVATENGMQQTVELLKKLAVPVGVKGLTILPESVLSQLTVADGLKIATDISPNFIE